MHLYAGPQYDENIDECKAKYSVFSNKEPLNCNNVGSVQPPAPSSENEFFSSWKLVSRSAGNDDLSVIFRTIAPEDNSARPLGVSNESHANKSDEANVKTEDPVSAHDAISAERNSSKDEFDRLITETMHRFSCLALCKATIETMLSCPPLAANAEIFLPIAGKYEEDCAWWGDTPFSIAAMPVKPINCAGFSEYLSPVGIVGSAITPDTPTPQIRRSNPRPVELLRHRARF